MKNVLMFLTIIICGITLISCVDVEKEVDVTNSSFISIEEYREKVRGAFIGQMIGVSWGYPVEFNSHSVLSEYQVPAFLNSTILEAYNQDDIYLSVTAIEELVNNGLDVSSRDLGIIMYNKDFEYWNGSNNDVLIRGYVPPLSGYPIGHGFLTGRFPDGNSYMCGGSFAGLLSPRIFESSNELADRFASLACYGDGIYGTAFTGALYAESIFENDYRKVIDKALEAIPKDSLVYKAVEDVIKWYDEGVAFEKAHGDFMQKYWYDETYNWIEWPYGGDNGRTQGINLDAKSCAAFIVMGLLYGKGDFTESVKYTIRCANDADSTAATTAGIIGTILKPQNIPLKYTVNLKDDQKIKYSKYTLDDIVDACEKLVRENVVKYGGRVGFKDNKEIIVIPNSIQKVTPPLYQSSRNPSPIDSTLIYTEEEMKKFRTVTDPGFERHNSPNLSNNWVSSNSKLVKVEYYVENEAHTGLSNCYIGADKNYNFIYTTANASKSSLYTISFYVKAKETTTVKLFVNNQFGVKIKEADYEVGTEWVQITLSFNTMSYDSIQIGIGYTSQNTSNYIRVDDLEFNKK